MRPRPRRRGLRLAGVDAQQVALIHRCAECEARWLPADEVAQMLAGHADIGTTANIYAHLDTTDLETTLRALNEKI